MLTLYFRTPINGVRVDGNVRSTWTIEKVDFHIVAENTPAPEPGLVRACFVGMRTAEGKQIAMEELRRYDLQEGLMMAFRAVQLVSENAEEVA